MSLLLVTGAAASAAPPHSLDKTTVAEVQARLDGAVQEHGLPGATAAIVTGDGRLVSFASGLSDREIGRKMTPDTRMMSGSIGKMFVSAVALSLVQDGVLDLDAPISQWLGQDSDYAKLPNYGAITVRMLLGHNSGLVDHVYMDSFWTVARERSKDADFAFAPKDLVAFGYGTKPLFKPGEGFHYTDLGYILLGLVIEKASGESYYTLLQQRFLYPLALSSTGPSNGRVFNGLAQGYLDASNPLLGEQGTALSGGVFQINTSSEWTGGGLVTSAGDLAEWAADLFEGRTRLGTKYAMEMVAKPGETGKPGRYGLGVYVFDTEFGPLYGHGGWFMGYRSFVGYFPGCHVSAAIQMNTERVEQTSVIFRNVFAPALRASGCASAKDRPSTVN